MLVLAMMSSLLLGFPNPLVAAREAGIFRSYKINGVPALSILSIPVIGTALHMAVVYALITFTAHPFFDGRLPTNVAWFIGIALLSTLATAGIGLLIGVVARNSRATVLLAQIVFLPSMMLGGLMMPTEMLPQSLARVAMLLPSTHIMNAFRGLSMDLPAVFDPMISIAILAASTLITFGLSVFLFQWDSQNSRGRSPLLALLTLVPYALAAVLVG